MRNKRILGLLAGAFVYFSSTAHDVTLNEIVTKPWQDYNGSGTITDSDEYFELYNASVTETYNLGGWRLELIDTTPESMTLESVVLAPKGFYVIQNPPGAQNNNGRLELYDNSSNLVDAVSYGNWEGSTAPSGNATGLDDESLSRYPDGSIIWVKAPSSRGTTNNPPTLGPFLTACRFNTNSVRINVSAVPGKTFVLQSASRLGDWGNIFTNEVAGTSFSVDESIKGHQRGFYRAKEYTGN